MSSLRVEFSGSGGAKLSGRLHLPAGPARAFALFAHCFTCSKDVKIAPRIASVLTDHGFGVLRFDFTGLGQSEGDFADTNFSSNIDDLLAAADYLRRQHAAPALLVGHSLGGAAVLAAAGRIEESEAVATIGAPSEPSHVRKLIDAEAPDLSDVGEAQVAIAGRSFRMKQQFLDDIESHCNASAIAALGRALLVMHSPQDNVVGVDNASSIFIAARHPKSFVSLDGADHLLSSEADAAYAAQTIAVWSQRYVTDLRPADESREGDPVRVNISDGYAVDISAAGHPLRADEPRSLGGTDTGPTPYGLLLSALGACTCITLRMYADRKKWPLEGISVALTHKKVHAKDCDECESTIGKVDIIDLDLQLHGPLDEEQRVRLLDISKRCPVHQTLTSENVIRTRAV